MMYQDERDHIKSIADSVSGKLQNKGFDGYEILTFMRDHALTRFANNVIHQPVESKGTWVKIKVNSGKRLQTIEVSAKQDLINQAIENLEVNMKLAPEVTFFRGFADQREFKKVDSTGKLLSSAEKSEVVEIAVNEAISINEKIGVFGKVESLGFHFNINNSNGVSGTHSFTFNDFKVMGIIEDNGSTGYGRESAITRDPKSINYAELTQRAVKIAQDTVLAKKIDPGEYSTIIRPMATTELVQYMVDGLSASPFHQGNSAFSDRLGENLLSDKLTIREDPLNPELAIASPFDSEGVGRIPSKIIDKGVPRHVFYDLLSSSEYLGESKSNGSAVIPFSEYLWITVSSMAMTIDEGNSNETEMIEDTQNGLLVQKFWYSNYVNPQKGVVTGLTRDGLFKIENGEITHAVKNMRYTDSYLSFFKNIDAISSERRQVLDEFNGSTLAPTMKLEKLRFIGSSK